MPETTTTTMETNANILTGADFRQNVTSAAEILYTHLDRICGPYAKYAVMPERDVNTYYHAYTKDGINIVRNIKFDNRTLEYVRHLTTYIGSRVDAKCHDGTTSAMMLFLRLLADIHTLMDNTEYTTEHTLRGSGSDVGHDGQKTYLPSESQTTRVQASDVHVKHRQQIHALKQELMRLRHIIEEETFRIDDPIFKKVSREDVTYYIAYHQALISSKGNTELAHSVAKVISLLPPELHTEYTLNRTSQETAKEFEVIQQKHDLSVIGSFTDMALLNKYMKTQYINEHADILAIDPGTLKNQNSPENQHFINFLKMALETNVNDDGTVKDEVLERDLILLTIDLDEQVLNAINKYNQLYTNKIVPINLEHGSAQSFIHVIEAIRCMAGVSSLGDPSHESVYDAFIQDVHVHFKGTTLYLTGLYEKDGETFHPYYRDPKKYPPYTQFITEIQQTIEEFENSAKPTEAFRKAMQMIIPLYRQMVCQNIWDLKIGGPLHDHVANFAMVQDAFGAATSAVSKGSIVGGLHRILAQYAKQSEVSLQDNSTPYFDVRCNVCTILEQALQDVLTSTYKRSPHNPTTNTNVPLHEFLTLDHTNFIELDVDLQALYPKVFPDDVFEVRDHEDYAPVTMEPMEKYLEIIDRLIEVLPKALATSSLVDVESAVGGITHG